MSAEETLDMGLVVAMFQDTDEDVHFMHILNQNLDFARAVAADEEKDDGEDVRPVHVEDFMAITVPGYREMDFREHFRMSRASVEVKKILLVG